MAKLRTVHTAWLRAWERQAIRDLLDEAFDEEIRDEDYEHALGGIHALVWEGGQLVGHGSVVMRRLVHRERALRTGYVEGVAVRSDRRRCGHGTSVMTALEGVIRGAYELGALGATDEAVAFYTGRGWKGWTGPASVITPQGIVPTPEEEGAIYVLPVTAELTPDADLTCDWRDGDVW